MSIRPSLFSSVCLSVCPSVCFSSFPPSAFPISILFVFYSVSLIRHSSLLSADSFIDCFIHQSISTPNNLSLLSQQPDLTKYVYTNLQDYYHSYLPAEHERSRFGEYEVTLDSVQTRGDVVVREMKMASIKVNSCFIQVPAFGLTCPME